MSRPGCGSAALLHSRPILPAAGTCAALLVVTVATGCSDRASGGQVVRRDSAGVEIIENRAPDRSLTWELEEEFRIGPADSGPAAFSALGPGLVQADSAARIYVLDREAKRVAVFDGSGSHLRSLGSEGGGPGEFRFPMAVAPAPGGEIDVYDLGKRSLVRFGRDGTVLPAEPLHVQYLGGPVRHMDSGLLVPTFEVDTPVTRRALLLLTPDDTVRLARVETRGREVDLSGSCGVRIASMPPVFSPNLRYAAHDSLIAAATSVEYEIRLLTAAGLLRIVRRSLPPREATVEMARREVSGWRPVAGGPECDPARTVSERGYADHLPAVDGLALGPEGRLWVRRGHVKGEPTRVDVFGSSGAYEGTLPAGSPFPTAFLPDGRFLAVERTELDVPFLAAYRIVRNAPSDPGP